MLEKTSSPPRIISSFLFRATILPRRAFHKTSEKFGETVSRKFRARKAVLCLPWCYWLWTPHSNQAAHKNTFHIFIPQKIPESNVLNPKNSFDYHHHLKSGVRGGTPDFKWRGARNCATKKIFLHARQVTGTFGKLAWSVFSHPFLTILGSLFAT